MEENNIDVVKDMLDVFIDSFYDKLENIVKFIKFLVVDVEMVGIEVKWFLKWK